MLIKSVLQESVFNFLVLDACDAIGVLSIGYWMVCLVKSLVLGNTCIYHSSFQLCKRIPL